MAFKYDFTVKLYDTDAAGLLFFGSQFRFAHDAYQTFMEQSGFSFKEVLDQGEILIPIVHAEADYSEALAVGDRLTIEMTAVKISEHSYVLSYDLKRPDGISAGTAQTVHVTIDRASGQKRQLPSALREALRKISG